MIESWSALIKRRWLRGKRREDFIIATKVRFSIGKGPNDVGLSRKHILGAVQSSLRRLATDYIDLYQVAEKGWVEIWSDNDNEHTWTVLDTLFAVAEETGKTPAQVAVNWLMSRPGITAPIIGARTLKQLEENLNASGWSLCDKNMERLSKVSEVPLPDPYGFIARMQRN
jgi:aryl-alcohol dehydrogenase-like predicted oxidoreductase